ncbi:MAG TPA: VOC family protein, partial [Burkholderiaceae bacterium]|nr:VOC family protein [Burkholderiaceae bacterium]
EDDAQLANVRRALAGAKVASREVAPTELSSLRIGTALRFGDDNGVEIEMYGGMQARPDGPLENPAGLRRLSHVVLFVPNLKKTLAFYESVLNFKVSDVRHKDDGHVYFAYLRCFPNPYHHSFAIVETPELRYFHTAFSIDSLDALMRRRNYLVRKQVVVAPTPGRHKASGSIFQYFSDPDGLTLEYTLGMEEFPEVGARGPRSLDAKPSTSDMWEGMRADNLPNVGTIVRIDG